MQGWLFFLPYDPEKGSENSVSRPAHHQEGKKKGPAFRPACQGEYFSLELQPQ